MTTGKNVTLGGFLLLSLALLTLVTFYLTGLSLKPRTTWVVYFGMDSMLEEGREVFTSGIRVGIVDALEPVPDDELAEGRYVKATLLVDSDITLWKGASVVLRSRGLLGAHRVELGRGTPGTERLSPDVPLYGSVAKDVMEQLSSVVEDNEQRISEITGNLAEMTGRDGGLGQLIMGEGAYNDLAEAAKNLQEFTETLNAPEGSLGRALRDQKLYDEMAGAFEGIRKMTETANAGKGSLGRVLKDETLALRLEEAADKVIEIAGGIERGEGVAGLILRDPQARDDLAAGLRGFRAFGEKLEKGEGTLGKLVSDSTVFANLERIASNMADLSDSIHRGEGSLGMLLKDDSLYNEARRMLESFREGSDTARENAPLASLTSFTALFFNVLN